jgi:hypothetical protein
MVPQLHRGGHEGVRDLGRDFLGASNERSISPMLEILAEDKCRQTR